MRRQDMELRLPAITPLDADELHRLNGRLSPSHSEPVSMSGLAEAINDMSESAEWHLNIMKAMCEGVLALLPDAEGCALYNHPAFEGWREDTPEGNARSKLMHNIQAVRELVSNGLQHHAGELEDILQGQAERAGVLTDSVARVLKRSRA